MFRIKSKEELVTVTNRKTLRGDRKNLKHQLIAVLTEMNKITRRTWTWIGTRVSHLRKVSSDGRATW